MHRFTLQAVMLFTLLTLPSAVLADRTYNIQNYPDLQNGWTLSGTITTDGTIGTIIPPNILSWTWTITNGASSFTVSSTDPGAVVKTTDGITATGVALLVPFPNQALLLTSPGGALTWGTDLTQYSTAGEAFLTPTTGTGWSTTETAEPGSPAWLFASTSPVAVPEPSSLNIVGFGAVCGCVHVMGHKRRARRTATTGA